MDNKDIAEVLEEMTTLMELNGENAFRIRSYVNAARQIDLLQEPASDLSARGELESVRGIGAKMAQNIATLIETGQLPGMGDLRSALPEGLLEMTDVPGLGGEAGAVDLRAIGYCRCGCARKSMRGG